MTSPLIQVVLARQRQGCWMGRGCRHGAFQMLATVVAEYIPWHQEAFGNVIDVCRAVVRAKGPLSAVFSPTILGDFAVGFYPEVHKVILGTSTYSSQRRTCADAAVGSNANLHSDDRSQHQRVPSKLPIVTAVLVRGASLWKAPRLLGGCISSWEAAGLSSRKLFG